MGRYKGPACRLCRREGMKLFLKGERCYMAKCPIEVGRGVPGMHSMQRGKPSDYSRQFREKQRLKRYYGLQNGQFMAVFDKASRRLGVTGDYLLQMLESRLDNIVYRLGFALSRPAARQFVRHRHISLNGRPADVPSIALKPGDMVSVRDNPAARALAKKSLETVESRTLSPWLSLDAAAFSGSLVRIPTRDEIAPLVDEQLVVELCSK